MRVPTASPGRVVTFYSYKGGSGRTMALANVACLLARAVTHDGQPIVMLDWDFEAPGLHRFFEDRVRSDPEETRRFETAPGVLDLWTSLAASPTKAPPPSAPADVADEFVAGLDLGSHVVGTGIPGLHLMKAGRFDDDYAARVNAFDWAAFYKRFPWLFPALARRLADEYAYALVDSRTGLTDTSGICTMLLPEKLVVVFTASRQSLGGLIDLIPRAIRYRRLSDDARPLAVFPLPSRIENSESELKHRWRHATDEDDDVDIGYQPLFERLFREAYDLESCSLDKYFDQVTIQHEPRARARAAAGVCPDGQFRHPGIVEELLGLEQLGGFEQHSLRRVGK